MNDGRARLGRPSRRSCARRCSSALSRAGTTPPAPPATALGAIGAIARGRADRPDRPRGVLRLPGQPPDDQISPRDRAARSSGPTTCCSPPRADGRRARPAAARRHRAEHCAGGPSPTASLDAAEVLGVEMVVTLGALIADVAHTRPVPITGLASDEALVEQLDLEALDLRGPDRGRRRLPRRLPRARDLPRPASGRPCPTTSPPSPTRRPAWRCCAGSRGWSGSPSRPPSSRRRRILREQVSRAVAANPEIEETGRAARGASRRGAGISRRTSPPARRIARDFQRYLRQQGELAADSHQALVRSRRAAAQRAAIGCGRAIGRRRGHESTRTTRRRGGDRS